MVSVARAVAILHLSAFALCWPVSSSGQSDDSHGPFVLIESPSNAFATNAAELEVTVRYGIGNPNSAARNVQGPFTQVRLWLNGNLVASHVNPRATRTGLQTFNLSLSSHPEGIAHIQAGAMIGAKHEVRSSPVAVFLDRTPPVVTITSPAQNQILSDRRATINGTIADNASGVSSLLVDGTLTDVVGGIFSVPITLPFSSNTITVTATDRAGNTATTEQRVLVSADPVMRPLLLAVPPAAAVVGKRVRYQPAAASTDPHSLVFSLTTAPRGMTIDSLTGLVYWTPEADQLGDHAVTIAAVDATGQTAQSFTLSVFGTRPLVSAAISAAAGGVIQVDDRASTMHGLSISIPPNGLLADTTVHVSELLTPPTLAGSSRFLLKGFVVEPDGTLLSAPASVRLPYSASEFKTGHGIPIEEFLSLYFLDHSTGRPEGLASFSVDAANRVLTGTVPHFSVYFVANAARLCPPPTAQSACPDAAPALSSQIPTLMVHGFQPLGAMWTGLGDESTWGNLRKMLRGLGVSPGTDTDLIGAWRFDWDSRDELFQMSAARLAAAIALVKGTTLQLRVNIVAHSFGGILVRTYLQGRAFGSWPYGDDINRLMTLGTPHQGIGGDFSLSVTDGCDSIWTCRQTKTGGGTRASDGEFLRQLNSALPFGLPPLRSEQNPQYYIVRGQQLVQLNGLTSLRPHDGLITLAGSHVCDPSECPANIAQETIAGDAAEEAGLCHSSALYGIPPFDVAHTCVQQNPGGQANPAMAEVMNKGHPLWNRICIFVGAHPDKCKPQVNVTVVGEGKVRSSNLQGIDCSPVCSAGFDHSTEVMLSAEATPGFKFDGWAGACSGTDTQCELVTGPDDKAVIATFSEVTASPLITDLGEGTAISINDAGQVFGVGRIGSSFGPFRWSATTGLQLLSGSAQSSGGINASGAVVAVPWDGQGVRLYGPNDSIGVDIPQLSGSDAAINDSNQIAGAINALTLIRAVVWDNSAITELPVPSAPLPERPAYSFARAINADGQVAGVAGAPTTASDCGHAALWNKVGQSYSLVMLGTLGGPCSEAWAINDVGHVAGYADRAIPEPGFDAFLWDGGMRKLHNPFGGLFSLAYGLNDLGQVVGVAQRSDGSNRAFFWQESTGMIDLNTLLPADSPWELSWAYDINNNGQIVGVGLLNGRQHGFLLNYHAAE